MQWLALIFALAADIVSIADYVRSKFKAWISLILALAITAAIIQLVWQAGEVHFGT
jgi:hypothetical protein